MRVFTFPSDCVSARRRRRWKSSSSFQMCHNKWGVGGCIMMCAHDVHTTSDGDATIVAEWKIHSGGVESGAQPRPYVYTCIKWWDAHCFCFFYLWPTSWKLSSREIFINARERAHPLFVLAQISVCFHGKHQAHCVSAKTLLVKDDVKCVQNAKMCRWVLPLKSYVMCKDIGQSPTFYGGILVEVRETYFSLFFSLVETHSHIVSNDK